MAECSLSTGIISAPLFFASSIKISPAKTKASLLARAILFPALIAVRVGSKDSAPLMAITTISASSKPATETEADSPVITEISVLARFFLSASPSFSEATPIIFGENSFA